jgi:glutamate dehydrogenase (NADP+)
VYFADEMLKTRGLSFEGKTVSVSGSGNVAQYAVEKAMQLGAKVVTVSDSSGTVYDPNGFTTEKLAKLMDIKNHQYGRVSDYAAQVPGGISTNSPREVIMRPAPSVVGTDFWRTLPTMAWVELD